VGPLLDNKIIILILIPKAVIVTTTVFFFHYQSLIIVTTIDLSIVNNANQTGRRVTVFHWQAKVWYPCMAWTNFINWPKTSRPWLYLTKHHKMSKWKLSFPDQSSIAKWLIKEKKDIFETLSVPLLDDIKSKFCIKICYISY
jgi:hypothetical protein